MGGLLKRCTYGRLLAGIGLGPEGCLPPFVRAALLVGLGDSGLGRRGGGQMQSWCPSGAVAQFFVGLRHQARTPRNAAIRQTYIENEGDGASGVARYRGMMLFLNAPCCTLNPKP